MFHNLDNFGSPVPAFNVKGKSKVTTIIGGLLTAMILTLTLAYAVQKLFAVFERTDPTINENIEANYYSKENGLNINESKMHFAMSYYNYDSNGTLEPKYDPRYVTLVSILKIRDNEEK